MEIAERHDKAGIEGGLAWRNVSRYAYAMALAIADKRISRDEYLEGELVSEIRHEYVAGNVYAMSGGTLNHQRIAGNFIRAAGNQLSGKSCFPTGSDFKLLVPLGGGDEAFYYPDGMIICVPVPGSALFTDSPSVILEVLSPTTRRTDEVQKFRDYITIPTLGTYILAETDTPLLTLHRRVGADFRREILSGPEAVLELPEAGVSIPLAELYRDVG
jgi:Uma2 family endonuclease